MRRFMVAAENLRDRDFISYLDSNDFGWWHWIDNFWLITIETDIEISAEILQNKVNEFSDSPRNMVIELHGTHSWSGHGPNSSNGGQNMFEWMHNTFDKTTE
ncbi:hypothetical protein [Vibrio ouci]|uniref:Uncharacterized protein n=1 Tax=Vibrio ouci TaxID=2499078 RepID=A0A4Y8W9Y8_9VIBR|nr:hypothetical protein [Vibrio ouci]TFH89208.1 hypothetical protein ELS82_23450 [Vibrio ouci]